MVVYKPPWLLISLWFRQYCTHVSAPPKACWSVSGRRASSCWQFHFPEKHRVRTPLNDVILMTHSTVMLCCHKARSSWPVQRRRMHSPKQEWIRLTVENFRKSGILVYLSTQCTSSHHMQLHSAVSLARGKVGDCSVLRSHLQERWGYLEPLCMNAASETLWNIDELSAEPLINLCRSSGFPSSIVSDCIRKAG